MKKKRFCVNHPDRKHFARGYCRTCYNTVIQREWREKNSDGYYNTRLKQMYGISYEEYRNMFTEQAGVCKVCKEKPEHEFPKRGGLVVDHCHDTGKVRGLLCLPCNQIVRSIPILERALKYAKETA